MKYDLLMNVDLHEALDGALQEIVRDDYGRDRWKGNFADQLVFLFVEQLREQLERKGLYRWMRHNESDSFWFVPVDEAEEIEAFQEVVRLGKKKEAARRAYLDLVDQPKPSLLQRVNDFLRGRWYGA